MERARLSPAAFGELYDHYYPIIYGYALRRVGNPQDAEDIAALTFERALQALERFEWKEVPFSAWIYRIASNLVTDHHRRVGRQRRVSFEEVERVLAVAEPQPERVERAARLMELMARLPQQYQHVLSLKFYEDLTLDEIAQVLGLNKKAAAMKLYRGLRALKKLVAESGMTLEEAY